MTGIKRENCENAYRIYHELDRLNNILSKVKGSDEAINFSIEGFPALGNQNSITCRSGSGVIIRAIQKEINFLNQQLTANGFETVTEKEPEND